MTEPSGNLLPALSVEEYEALKADIARRGVLVPIELDAASRQVLDGAHRLRACRELGLPDPPAIERRFNSEQERAEHALVLNLLRRQLGPVSWAQAFTQLLAARGVERGAGTRNDLATSATVAQVARELGVGARTAFRRLTLADELAQHPDLAARVDRGELAAPAAVEQARQRAREHTRSANAVTEALAPPLADEVVFICAAFAHALPGLDDGSVDLLLTDPPYGIDYRQSRRWASTAPPLIAGDASLEQALALFAHALDLLTPKLAPAAQVLVFCSWRTEPPFRAALETAGLRIHSSVIWVKESQGVGDTRHAFAPMHERILHASRGDAVLQRREPDVLQASRVRRPQHRAQKPIALLERLIKATTRPGALVCDPFAGVASTLIAALHTGRRSWGCEIDPDHHHAGIERLRAEAKGREVA